MKYRVAPRLIAYQVVLTPVLVRFRPSLLGLRTHNQHRSNVIIYNSARKQQCPEKKRCNLVHIRTQLISYYIKKAKWCMLVIPGYSSFPAFICIPARYYLLLQTLTFFPGFGWRKRLKQKIHITLLKNHKKVISLDNERRCKLLRIVAKSNDHNSMDIQRQINLD